MSSLKIIFNKRKKESFVPRLRNEDWFQKNEIIYYFLEEKDKFKRGKVIEVNSESRQVKVKINNSLKSVNIRDPRLLRPEDIFLLIIDPIHLRGWLGSCFGYPREFKVKFEKAIQKERENFF